MASLGKQYLHYKKVFTPPYSKKDIKTILITFFLLLFLPLLIYSIQLSFDDRSRAAENKGYEAESGVKTGPVTEYDDPNASGGKAIVFGATLAPSPSGTQPTNTPSPTSAPQTVTLNATMDAHVDAGQQNNNFGSATTLLLDSAPVKLVFFKFDISSVKGANIQSAKLKLRVATTGSGQFNLNHVTNTTWTETGISYANQPPLGNSIAQFSGRSAGQDIEINATQFVKNYLTANPNATSFSLALSAISGEIGLKSRETSDDPQLIIVK